MVHFVEDVGVDVQRHMDVRMTQPGFEHDCRDASLDAAGRESMAQSMLAAGFDPGSAKDLPELTVHTARSDQPLLFMSAKDQPVAVLDLLFQCFFEYGTQGRTDRDIPHTILRLCTFFEDRLAVQIR